MLKYTSPPTTADERVQEEWTSGTARLSCSPQAAMPVASVCSSTLGYVFCEFDTVGNFYVWCQGNVNK